MIGALAAHMLMPMPAPGEPSSLLAEPVDLLFGYLDYFEDVTLRKIGGLTEDQLRHSSVPSGWTPLGMIKHLAGTERFWIRHVFLGEQLDFADDPAHGKRRIFDRVYIGCIPPFRKTIQARAGSPKARKGPRVQIF
jgi:hypothetical protein